ncbi:methylmalonyl-CoA mutase [Nocardioides immobilis]|uniref:Methylmalonyl-CoA mutase n=1 Tax=Nocardioides immobilis TaxID=2049295 RepID=A0A417Y123_9ACTN|nr:methylmalonyl-CoA mutase [Nocardioides immobilis]
MTTVQLSRTKTWGGIPTKSHYTAADLPAGHNPDEKPGEYPFTRGAFPEMYRSRMWSMREIVGYAAPEDTREGLQRAIANGASGMNVVDDLPTKWAVDPDHPLFRDDVGVEGVSVPTLRDCERLLEGVDLAKVDLAWHSIALVYPLTVAVHKKRGQSLDGLLGSHMPDYLHQVLSGWGAKLVPPNMALRMSADCIDYATEFTPKWSLGVPQAYDLRERGVNPSQEIALGMAIVQACLDEVVGRGRSVDDVASKMAWVSTSDVDFFEEVAKFRALRRVWARTMKERYGATSERAMRLRIAVHTSGKSLVYQQPLNNLSRTAIQSFAAICGGVQSVETCTYDEPISIPSDEAKQLALRTQQILAHEVGAARVADPLAGSYYVEALTDAVERDALAFLERIEEKGLVAAIDSGWLEAEMDAFNVEFDEELQSGDRLVVGKNAFTAEDEETPSRFEERTASIEAHVRRFVEFRDSRDMRRVGSAISTLYDVTRQGGNPYPPMIEALIADATVSEVWGTLRQAFGHAYDAFGIVDSPFDLSPA